MAERELEERWTDKPAAARLCSWVNRWSLIMY